MYARRRRRPTSLAYLLGAGALVLAGIVLAIVLAGGPNEPGAKAQGRDTTSVSTTVETQQQAQPEPVDGAALNESGFELMQAGDYEGALPLLKEAVSALQGSGSLAEAYASYNLAFTRFALGNCDGVIGLLDRSESIQGHRDAIDELRGAWEESCAELAPGRGNGNGKGNGEGRSRKNQDE
jgi:hypothetical protein